METLVTGDLLARIRFQENDRPNIRIRWLNLMRERIVALSTANSTVVPGISFSGGDATTDFGSTAIFSGGSASA